MMLDKRVYDTCPSLFDISTRPKIKLWLLDWEFNSSSTEFKHHSTGRALLVHICNRSRVNRHRKAKMLRSCKTHGSTTVNYHRSNLKPSAKQTADWTMNAELQTSLNWFVSVCDHVPWKYHVQNSKPDQLTLMCIHGSLRTNSTTFTANEQRKKRQTALDKN